MYWQYHIPGTWAWQIMTIITLITIMSIMNILHEWKAHIRYYVQQLFGLVLRCCIDRQKCKDPTLWSRDFCSLSFQGCPLHICTPWRESVKSNSSRSHVCCVHLLHSSKGVASGDVPDHFWDRDWPYLSNSTLSRRWFRSFRRSCRGRVGGSRRRAQLGPDAVRSEDIRMWYILNALNVIKCY